MEDFNRIFISYHRSDSEADAGRLGDALRRRLGDERVFTDVIDIEFGANWERVVDHTLKDSVAVLLLIGPAWMLTDSILYEVRAALNSAVSIIPILVRGVDWATLTDDLPTELQPLRKFNAHSLDHSSWDADIEPLVELLERMLADPARARVICKRPEPIALLRTSLYQTNVRSLLVHAADLAECLDDASVLAEAQQMVTKSSPGSSENLMAKEIPPGLISALGDARYRLMMEQIGRDLLKHFDAARVAQYLQDPALEKEIRGRWKLFEEEKTEWRATRGDSGDPGLHHGEAHEADEKARDRLRKQLPGMTKRKETRDRLFQLVENQVTDLLSKGRIEDYWEYTILKHFSSYPDMRLKLYDRDRPKVGQMLKRFKTSTRVPGE